MIKVGVSLDGEVVGGATVEALQSSGKRSQKQTLQQKLRLRELSEKVLFYFTAL
jgi:hypothetical protein